MVARAIVASLALLASAGAAYAQDAVIRIDPDRHHSWSRLNMNDYDSTMAQWEALRSDTELLYLDFDSRSSKMLDNFLSNMTELIQTTINRANTNSNREERTRGCWEEFERRMRVLENNKRRMAVYIRHSHHKYIMGHKVVFNMHLNKTESILKKWNAYTRDCAQCWNTHTIRRFHQRATAELNRVKNDINFTRRAYTDLVSHCLKELNKAKRQMINDATQNVVAYEACICKE